MNMEKYFNKYTVSLTILCFLFCLTLSLTAVTIPALVVLLVLDGISYFWWKHLIKGMSDEELCEKLGLKNTIFDFTEE